MRIPEEVVTQIREKIDIVDVVGDYVDLEKRGRNHFACCPFHQEDTPSFSVAEDKQIFYCFGCHEGGNVFNFLMKIDGLSFPEAVIKAATYTDVDLTSYEQQNNNYNQSNPLKPYYELNKFVSEFYAYVLQTDKGTMAKKYLTSRNISEEVQKRFELGFAPDDHVLAELIKENNYNLQDAEELGLVFQSQNMIDYFDAMRGRIVFPIKDNNGNYVAFTGRTISSAADVSKYYHSHESKVFQKRTILYNYKDAEASIRREKKVYICEGIFDVIALYNAGITNVVATLGTAVTTEQLTFLKNKKLEVVFVFDNDKAGKKATLRALELAQQAKVTAQTIIFWEYAEKDLDELLQATNDSTIRKIFEQQYDIFEYAMKYYTETFNLENNEERQTFVKEIFVLLTGENPATIEFYEEKLMELTGLSKVALDNLKQSAFEVDTTKIIKRSPHLPPEDPGIYPSEPFDSWEEVPQQPLIERPHMPSRISRQRMCELLIIKGILQGDAYIKLYQQTIVLSQNLLFRKIIYAILEERRRGSIIETSALYERLSPEETAFFTEAITRLEPVDEDSFEELLEILKREAEERHYKEEARKSDTDKNNKIEQIQNLLDFKRKINNIKGE